MKTIHKLGLLGVFTAACAFNPLNANALTNTMPEANSDGVIKLEDHVTLTSGAWVNNGTVTIDLNGYNLTRSGYYGYLINNSKKDSKLTIIDSKGTGSIVCEAEPGNPKSPSSCIRNNGTLEINGVKKIESEYHTIKTEEESTTTIKKTNIRAISTKAAGIQNYGTLTVEDSYIEGAKDPEGAAIFSLSWNDGAKAYSSSATVKNSTLYAYWPVIIEKYNKTEPVEGETIKVVVENSELKRDRSLKEDDRIARIQSVQAKSNEPYTLTLKGEITAPVEALEYLEDGAVLKLNENLTKEVTVPAGMRLVVATEIGEGGKIIFEEGAVVENRSGKDITVYTEFNGEEKEITVPNNAAVNKYEEPVDPTEPIDPTEPEDPTTPTEPENPKDDENQPDENPKTLDGVTAYAALAGLSVGALGLVLKKNLD